MDRLKLEDVDVVIGRAINACIVDCNHDTCHCELVRDLAYATIEDDPITVDDVAEAIAEDRQRQSQESVRSEALQEVINRLGQEYVGEDYAGNREEWNAAIGYCIGAIITLQNSPR